MLASVSLWRGNKMVIMFQRAANFWIIRARLVVDYSVSVLSETLVLNRLSVCAPFRFQISQR